MKLEFESITLENVGSFKAAQTLHFSKNPGLYFLAGRNVANPRIGANGVGKTTIWRALAWCLYGKTVSGLRTPDLKPWATSGMPNVMIDLRINGTATYIKRNGNKIVIDGKDAEQADIDKLIGMSLECFSNTVALAQGEDLFLDLPPKGKLNLLADALELEHWEGRAKKAAAEYLKQDGVCTRLKQEIGGLEYSLEHFKQLLEVNQRDAKEWETERADKLKTSNEQIKHCMIEANEVKVLLDNAKFDLDRAAVRLNEVRNDDLTEKVAEARAATTVAYDKLYTARQKHADVGEDLKNVPDKCPTCGQTVRNEARKIRRKALEVEQAKLEAAITRASDFYKDCQDTQTKIELRAKDKLRQVQDLETKVDDMNTAVTNRTDRHSSLRAQLDLLHKQLNSIKDEYNPYLNQAQELRRKSAQTKSKLEELEAQLKAVQVEAERCKFWIKGFRDVSLFLIEEVLEEVEITCNAMLPDVGLDGWQMFFEVERETASGGVHRGLNVWVLSPHNSKPVRWECWSGGEGQRLRIIASLALSEVLLAHAGVQTNMEVLDEPTRHLSVEGTQDLCGFLADRAVAVGRQTWWVDHQVIQSNRFSGMITVVRDKEGSKLDASY